MKKLVVLLSILFSISTVYAQTDNAATPNNGTQPVIYPNPSTGTFAITTLEKYKLEQLQLFNLVGTQVPYKIIVQNDDGTCIIEVEEEGLLFMAYVVNGKHYCEKVLIKK